MRFAHQFAHLRLATIKRVLGPEIFNDAVAIIEDKWNREWFEFQEEQKNLKPCAKCGEERTLLDVGVEDLGLCRKCR